MEVPEEEEEDWEGEEDETSGDTEELLETLYTKTKSHLQKKSQDAKSVADKKKTTRCADCKELGHWRGDPECKFVKSGQTQVRQPSSSAQSSAPTKKSTYWNTVCMESASSDRRSKRRNEVVLVHEDFRESMVDLGQEVRTIGTQTDITGPVLPAEEKIPGDVD
eukprot:2997388-Amphidinium_carterae.1